MTDAEFERLVREAVRLIRNMANEARVRLNLAPYDYESEQP